jgi:hypothetical protein
MLLLFAVLGAAVHRGTPLQPPTWEQLQFHVALEPGLPARYKVVGWLCGRPPLSGRTVQVLISGTTQTHVYWDFPLRPQQHSYVHALTNAGYATLNLDRLGSDQSRHTETQAGAAGAPGGPASEHSLRGAPLLARICPDQGQCGRGGDADGEFIRQRALRPVRARRGC